MGRYFRPVESTGHGAPRADTRRRPLQGGCGTKETSEGGQGVICERRTGERSVD